MNTGPCPLSRDQGHLCASLMWSLSFLGSLSGTWPPAALPPCALLCVTLVFWTWSFDFFLSGLTYPVLSEIKLRSNLCRVSPVANIANVIANSIVLEAVTALRNQSIEGPGTGTINHD